jgi:hypothetical protein
MDDQTLRRIAYAIARSGGSHSGSIYSHSRGRHSNMSGSGGAYYDHETGSHFSDSYDYSTGSHWNYTLNGENFSGYHHGSGHHFSGSVRNGSVQIYDHGSGSWHNFQA